MTATILQQIALVLIYIACILTFLGIIGFTVIDIRTANLRKKLAKLPKNLKHRALTVIVYTRNCEDTIMYTLDSIKAQHYRALRVVVIDNNSDDTTKQIIKSYSAKLPIKLIAKRTTSSYVQTLQQAVKSVDTASLVLKLDSGNVLGNTLLRDINKKYYMKPSTGLAMVAVLPEIGFSYVQLAVTIRQLLSNRTRAVLELLGKTKIKSTSPFLGTSNNFQQLTDVVSSPKSIYEIPVSAISAGLFIYGVYNSIYFGSTQLLLSYVSLMLINVALIIFSSSQLDGRGKLVLFSTIPIIYFVVIVTAIFEQFSFINASKIYTVTD